MKQVIAGITLAALILGGAGCDDSKPCQDGTDSKWAKPREGSVECDKRKAKMTPTEVS